MTDPIYCPVMTYPQTRESPAEWCEEVVEVEGDLCTGHDVDDEAPERGDR